MAKTTLTPDEQLEDLTRRFALLEGERKAQFETAEMNKKQNKEIIKQMKDENKALQTQIAQLREEKPESAATQLENATSEVQRLQRQVDLIKSENAKKAAHLEELDGKLTELSLDANLPTTEASPEMRQIRVLENRLDKAMIKYNEAQSIRRTYEAILKRLKEERIGFDNQLAAIERTLKAKERDYEELLLLSHDANHAREMAQAELHRFEQGVTEERLQRDKEVQEKKALVHQRVDMNHRLEQREKMLKKQQEADRQNERLLKEQSATSDLMAGMSDAYAQEERQKLQECEDAFFQIKEATGVSDVNEVIQKFLTQEDTRKDLINLTKENQATIEKLTDERRRLRLQVEELKFSSGGTVGRRQAIDDFATHISEATEKFERNKSKFERMAKMHIDMKSGIGHLYDKLSKVSAIKLDGEKPTDKPIELTDSTVEEVLQRCELKLSRLMNLTHHLDDPNDRRRMMLDGTYEEKMMARSQSDVRVKIADRDQDADNDDDDFDEEMDEDVPNRTHIKHGRDHIIEQQQKKGGKKGKAKKRAD